MRKRYLSLVTGILMGFGPLAALPAGVYKWVDATGVVHYGEVNRYDSERISRRYLAKREIPARDHAVPAAFAHRVGQRCAAAQERLASYRAATRLYQRDPGGNRTALSESQVRLLLAETERDEHTYCQANAAGTLYAQERARLRAGVSAPDGPKLRW